MSSAVDLWKEIQKTILKDLSPNNINTVVSNYLKSY